MNIEVIRDMYNETIGDTGKKKFSNSQIAFEHDISVARLNKIIDRHHFQSKKETFKKIINAVKNGHSIGTICGRFNVSSSLIYNLRKIYNK